MEVWQSGRAGEGTERELGSPPILPGCRELSLHCHLVTEGLA